jgi:hypothetical protein
MKPSASAGSSESSGGTSPVLSLARIARLHRTHRWPIPGWSARSGDDFRSPSVRKFIRIPLTNNTAVRKACALPASRNAGAFGKLRAACVRYRADLGCPRITPRFIQNAPRDSILSAAFDSVPAALMKVETGVRFEPDTPRHGVFELRAESAVSKHSCPKRHLL